jgi:hypothetical protein
MKLGEGRVEVNATIWFAKGDHFFIQCDNLAESGLCKEKRMLKMMPQTDNVNFFFKAAPCDTKDTFLLSVIGY